MNSSSSSSINNGLLLPSFIRNNRLSFVIILLTSMVVLSIIILLIVAKCIGKKQRPMERQKVIVKRHLNSESDISSDSSIALLEQNDNKSIHTADIISNDDMDKIFSSNLIPQHKISDASTSSVPFQNTSVNGINDNDDLESVNFTSISLPPLLPSDINTSTPHGSRTSSYKNVYITEFILQEKKKAEDEKPSPDSPTDSDTSEESCY